MTLIDKEELIKVFAKECNTECPVCPHCNENYNLGNDKCYCNLIINFPVQQEIVKCKDCMYYKFYGLENEIVSECLFDHAYMPYEDWFCADGERRQEEL